MIELEKFEKNDGTWRVRLTYPGFWEASEDEWDVPTEELADTLIKAVNYGFALGEGVYIHDSEEIQDLRAIWHKHELPIRGRGLQMSLNEVLLHYKGFLAAEKAGTVRRRGDRFVTETKTAITPAIDEDLRKGWREFWRSRGRLEDQIPKL